jgi:uncharacterized protein YsxB (DUF464 family)
MSKVKDGVYLVYVKDGLMYPVVLKTEEWEMLQYLTNSIANPLQVLQKSMGEAINLSEHKNK